MLEDKDFIGHIFPQNCGDSLFVLEKSNIKKRGKFCWKCIFQKYPFEILALKDHILRGVCVNPQIEQIEFINKIWEQNCGDSLKIIRKTEQKYNNKEYLWECEFVKYPYKILKTKTQILSRTVNNPQIEIEKFVNKIWHQNCGDDLKVIEKIKKPNKDGYNKSYFRCQFLKYPYEIIEDKTKIIEGKVTNPAFPWYSRESLKDFIKENFKDKKPTLQELSNLINLSISFCSNKINELKLNDYVKYYPDSNSENNIRKFIQLLNIETLERGKTLLDNQEIDIYIPSLKIGFEYNGNYWHSELYKKQNYHQDKILKAIEKNIELFHIWEWEWEQKQEICKYFIKGKLGIFEKKIGASKCKIRELNNKVYQDFCNKNHLQGEAGAKIKLGLFYKEELIQIMSFGSPRFSNEFDWEIIRECSKLGYCILGGKNKLWSYFVKKYNPKNCISYCDFSKFRGDSYLKLGFKKERLNKPGFWWFDNKTKQIYWRSPQNHKEMKEKYLKLYDAGQLVFIWNK